MFIRAGSHVEFVENHVHENEQCVARVKNVRSGNGNEEDNIHIAKSLIQDVYWTKYRRDGSRAIQLTCPYFADFPTIFGLFCSNNAL